MSGAEQMDISAYGEQLVHVSLGERFMAKVAVEGDCWVWQGVTVSNRTTYGRFRVGDRMMLAHRYAYMVVNGELVDGMEIDHQCRNGMCVNPAHLRQVTPRENKKKIRNHNQAKTHCLRGHPLSGDNLRVGKDRRRGCRECVRIRSRKRAG